MYALSNEVVDSYPYEGECLSSHVLFWIHVYAACPLEPWFTWLIWEFPMTVTECD